jgi:hypothetical protein
VGVTSERPRLNAAAARPGHVKTLKGLKPSVGVGLEEGEPESTFFSESSEEDSRGLPNTFTDPSVLTIEGAKKSTLVENSAVTLPRSAPTPPANLSCGCPSRCQPASSSYVMGKHRRHTSRTTNAAASPKTRYTKNRVTTSHTATNTTYYQKRDVQS